MLAQSVSIPSILEVNIHGSSQQKTIIFLTMVLGWCIFYNIINITCKFKYLSIKKSNDTKNRIVSMTHGVITFIWACCLYLPYPGFNQPNSIQESSICMFSLAYSVYDLLACLYYGLFDMGLLIHHLCCAVGFGTAVFTGYGAIDAIGGLLVAQSSNFPMHLRSILRNFKLRYTKSYELSQSLYLGLYILFRGILGPFILWYPSVTSQNSPIPTKVVCTLLLVQSFYYIYNMGSIIKKKLQQKSQMDEKRITYEWMKQNPEVQTLSFYRKSDDPKIF